MERERERREAAERQKLLPRNLLDWRLESDRIFHRERGRMAKKNVNYIFFRSPVDKRPAILLRRNLWAREEERNWEESIRKFAEVRRKCMNAPLESQEAHAVTFTWIELRGSSLRYRERSEISVAGSIGARPGIPSRPECRGANERSERASYEIGGSRRKNFNLDIFREEPSRARIRHENLCIFFARAELVYVSYNTAYYTYTYVYISLSTYRGI